MNSRVVNRLSERISLQLRIVAACLLVLAGALWASLTWYFGAVESNTLRARRAHETSEARSIASLLDMRIRRQADALQVVARSMPAGLFTDPTAREAWLRNRALLLADFNTAFLASTDGTVLFLHDEHGFSRPDANFADRDYFQRALVSSATVISEPLIGKVTDQPLVAMALGVRENHRVVGIVGASVQFKKHSLLKGLQGARLPGEDNRAAVLVTDRAGTILYHEDDRLIGKHHDAEPQLVPVMAQWLAKGRPLNPNGSAVDTPQAIGAVASLDSVPWLVWRIQPLPAAMAPVAEARRQAGQVAALVLAIAALALWLAVRGVLRPVRTLGQRAAQVLEGDLQSAFDGPFGAPELDELGRVLTELQRRRAGLALSNARTQQLLISIMASAPVGIMLTHDRHFDLVNQHAARLLGRAPKELEGQPAQCIYASNEDYQRIGTEVAAAFARRDAFVTTLRFLGPEQGTFWGRLRGQPLDWDDPSAGTIWTLANVTDEVESRARLEWDATHDALTGMANRVSLDAVLRRLIENRPRSQPAALLILDLDRFKPVNDQHGHAAGDHMLRQVADAIMVCVRGGDLVARIGGDEFAVALERCSAEVARRVAEDIQRSVAEMAVAYGDAVLHVGCSIGVAPLDSRHTSVEDWMSDADRACYADKSRDDRKPLGQLHHLFKARYD